MIKWHIRKYICKIYTLFTLYTLYSVVHSYILTVMVNFMCQFEWVIRDPDIWPNIILSVSMRVFLDEINILIGTLNKADCSP